MRRFFLLAVTALLAGCAAPPSAPTAKDEAIKGGTAIAAPAPTPPDPKTQMAPLESRIAVLVEEAREKRDPAAHRLVLDAELSRIARARAEDMAAKNYLAHAAPDGETSASLLIAEDEKFQGLLGENLAAEHYLKQSGVDVDVFAHRFVDLWMDSPPHRDNLAWPQYDRAGVGAAVNGDTVYVAFLLASDLGLSPPRDAPVPKNSP